MPKKAVPTSATIFTYQVGFGDCFLLRFTYPDQMRHVLIDFGTTGLPESTAKSQLLLIAKDIAEKCDGNLDAVVATHRHADHISGFATSTKGNGAGDVIRALRPRVVVQPWTEQLDLGKAALEPKLGDQQGLRAHALAFSNMQKISEHLLEQLRLRPKAFSARLSAQLRFIGEDNLTNASAVKNLSTMGAKQIYTYHGGPSGLDSILPGVKTHVLGPPTLRQTDTISKMTSKDKEEYWHIQLRRLVSGSALSDGEEPLFPGAATCPGGKLPMSARWLAYRMKEVHGEQMLQIVRALDKQMNNTSLILLFQTATKKLLFPGDAQIENWRFALGNKKISSLLADVDLYKVGHHGSLNATPRSMWSHFSKKGTASKRDRLTTILSTMPNKHGDVGSNTEVPRTTLLKELKSQSALHSTHELAKGALYEEIRIAF